MRLAPEREVCSDLWLRCTLGFVVANLISANVDEVFVDLSRQMLRKQDEHIHYGDGDDGSKYNLKDGQRRRRRLRLRDGSHVKCVIL